MMRKLTLLDIAPLMDSAKRSGLAFCEKTELYGICSGGDVIAFAGLLRFGNKIVIKNIYVIEAERGRGHFKRMVGYFLQKTKGHILEANCTKMSIRHFIGLGFSVSKVFKNGITQVRYENLS